VDATRACVARACTPRRWGHVHRCKKQSSAARDGGRRPKGFLEASVRPVRWRDRLEVVGCVGRPRTENQGPSLLALMQGPASNSLGHWEGFPIGPGSGRLRAGSGCGRTPTRPRPLAINSTGLIGQRSPPYDVYPQLACVAVHHPRQPLATTYVILRIGRPHPPYLSPSLFYS
jgi:hypothetical protein